MPGDGNNGGTGVVIIDGSQGEGGGQIFRTALTLAMCTGKAVTIENIRAGRKKPGLLRQHLACLKAASAVCNAQVDGDALGSRRVVFRPGAVIAGHYRFAVGSAGSTALVFQTVFLPLALAGGSSELYLEGGTHNSMAPSVDFIAHSFLPVLAAVGWQAEVSLERHGFYPSGGGAWCVRISPAQQIRFLELLVPGELKRKCAIATSANIPAHVIERELEYVKKKCYWNDNELVRQIVSSPGQGNIVSVRLHMENTSAVFEAVGERNLTAERVAGRAVKAMKNYLHSGAAVCSHLADQLLLPLVLGCGGKFSTMAPTEHLRTNIAVITQMLPATILLQPMDDGVWYVDIAPSQTPV